MPYADTAQARLPYASGSETSRDAAIRALAFAETQEARYFRWLSQRDQGGTDAEAEREIPMKRQSVCARRNELVNRGLVINTGLRRGHCAVWMVR
jgi:hypothetical protein